MVGPQRPQIVLFGSSIIHYSYSHHGWGAILNSHQRSQAVHPSLVIVFFGGNDSMHPHPTGLGPHVPLPEYVENMRKIAINLKGLSDKTRVIFLSTPPVNETQIRKSFGDSLGRTNESGRKYSDACVELCQGLGIKVIDLWSALQKRDDWLDACFTDGIHLSLEGSKIVVSQILRVLKDADWEPSLHWKSLPTEFSEDSPYDFIGPDGKTPLNVSNCNTHWETQWGVGSAVQLGVIYVTFLF